jgi:hypothetical protein
MTTYLFPAVFVFVGLAYIIFGRISSQAYNARPFDRDHPPKSPGRYLWNVHRELYPQSYLRQALKACVIVAAMTLIAALVAFSR